YANRHPSCVFGERRCGRRHSLGQVGCGGSNRLVARVPNARMLKASILAGQTSAEDAGRMAQAAGVKTLVLSHLVPADDPQVTDHMWIEAARVHFRGPVIVGKDLLEL